MGKKQEDFPEIDLSDRVAIFIDGSNLYHSLEENEFSRFCTTCI